MLLVSEALTERGKPAVTALAATLRGSHVHAEALFIEAGLPAGPLPCVLHTSTQSSERVVIDWPGYPASSMVAVPSGDKTHFIFSTTEEE